MHEMGIFRKTHFVFFEIFWNFLRNITIYKSNEEDWNKFFVVLIPIFSPFVILYAITPSNYFYLIGGVFPVL